MQAEKDMLFFKQEYYGVIHEIKNGTCEARIYDSYTHEFQDSITFDISEFTKIEQSMVDENVLFTWIVGKDESGCYSLFKLKNRS